MLVPLLLTSSIGLVSARSYTYFSDQKGVGIRNEKGEECLRLSLDLQLLNHNLGPDSEVESINIGESVLGGHCGARNSTAMLSAFHAHQNRTRTIKFYFNTANVLNKQFEELRWQLFKMSYSEQYNEQKISFRTPPDSIVFSSPFKQGYTCRDKVNVTLRAEGYDPVEIFILPPIIAYPFGETTNMFLCERTRRRTLSESLETRATVFSGVVLLLSSLGIIIGHAVRRQLMPSRKALYDNLR